MAALSLCYYEDFLSLQWAGAAFPGSRQASHCRAPPIAKQKL